MIMSRLLRDDGPVFGVVSLPCLGLLIAVVSCPTVAVIVYIVQCALSGYFGLVGDGYVNLVF